MAKLNLRKTLGSDPISKSRIIINENFDQVENEINLINNWLRSSDKLDNYYPTKFDWTTDMYEDSVIGHMWMQNMDKEIETMPIPSASRIQSGVITGVKQDIGGLKSFHDGIRLSSNSSLYVGDKMNIDVITHDSNERTVYIGGKDSGLSYGYTSYGKFKGWKLPDSWKNVITTSINTEFNAYKDKVNELIKLDTTRYQELYDKTVDIENLKAQVDKEIQYYFGTTHPDNHSEFRSWNNTSEKEKHVGDIYVNKSSRECYRYDKKVISGGFLFEWVPIQENSTIKILLEASEAKAAADGKITIYYGCPNANTKDEDNYQVGDMWIADAADEGMIIENGVKVVAGYMYFCIKDRSETFQFDPLDWSKKLKYSDDEAAIRAENAIKDLNDDSIFSIFEKNSILDTYYELTGRRTKVSMQVACSQSLGRMYKLYSKAVVTNTDDPNYNDWVARYDEWKTRYDELNEYLSEFGVFDNPLTSSDNFEKSALLALLNKYYMAEEEISEIVTRNIVSITASEAQITIDMVNAKLDSINNDGVLSGIEKKTLMNEWYNISFKQKLSSADENYDADSLLSSGWDKGTFCDTIARAEELYNSSDDTNTKDSVESMIDNLKSAYNTLRSKLIDVRCDSGDDYPKYNASGDFKYNYKVYCVIDTGNAEIPTKDGRYMYLAVPYDFDKIETFDNINNVTPFYYYTFSDDMIDITSETEDYVTTLTGLNWKVGYGYARAGQPVVVCVSNDGIKYKFNTEDLYSASYPDTYLYRVGDCVINIDSPLFNREDVSDVLVDYYQKELHLSNFITESKLGVVIGKIDSMEDDGTLSVVEKLDLRRDWKKITGQDVFDIQTSIAERNGEYNVSINNSNELEYSYNYAYDAAISVGLKPNNEEIVSLKNKLNVLGGHLKYTFKVWEDEPTDLSSITTDLSDIFQDYYTQENILSNLSINKRTDDAIAVVAKRIDDMESDGLLDPTEKLDLRREWKRISGSDSADVISINGVTSIVSVDMNSNASYAVTLKKASGLPESELVDLKNSFGVLAYHLKKTFKLWDGTTTQLPVSPDLSDLFQAYYNEEQNVNNKIVEQSGAGAAAAAVGYLSDALGGSTSITGGLVLGNILGVRSTESSGSGTEDIIGGIDGTNNKVGFWTGGTYTQATAGTAKTIFNKDGSGQLAGGNISWNISGDVTVKGEIKLRTGSEVPPVWLKPTGVGSNVGPLSVISKDELFVGEPSYDTVVTCDEFKVTPSAGELTYHREAKVNNEGIETGEYYEYYTTPVPGTDKTIKLFYKSYESGSSYSGLSTIAGIGNYIIREYEKSQGVSTDADGNTIITFSFTAAGTPTEQDKAEFTLQEIGEDYTVSYDYQLDPGEDEESGEYVTFEQVYTAGTGNSFYEIADNNVGILLPHKTLDWIVVSPVFELEKLTREKTGQVVVKSILLPVGVSARGGGQYVVIYKYYQNPKKNDNPLKLNIVDHKIGISSETQGVLFTSESMKQGSKKYGTTIAGNGISTEGFKSITNDFGFTNIVMNVSQLDTNGGQYFYARPSLAKLNRKLGLSGASVLKSKKMSYSIGNYEDGTVVLGKNTFDDLLSLISLLKSRVNELINHDDEIDVADKNTKRAKLNEAYDRVEDDLGKFAVLMVKHNSATNSKVGTIARKIKRVIDTEGESVSGRVPVTMKKRTPAVNR